MKEVKLVVDGKEFSVMVDEEQIQDLTKKKTGYERVEKGECYYMPIINGSADSNNEDNDTVDNYIYENASYYSDKTIAKNNARADKLYRQLRRFAVEHRESIIDWDDRGIKKYCISYNHLRNNFVITCLYSCQEYGVLCFDTNETAQLAIDTFKDELIWYFTEYNDSL